MSWRFWRKRPHDRSGDFAQGMHGRELSKIQHEVGNAVLGFELERRRALSSLREAFEAISAMRKHQKRIEEALRGGPDNG